MEPIVNLEETPGKVVGNRRPPADSLAMTDAQRVADAVAWQRAFGGFDPIVNGQAKGQCGELMHRVHVSQL